MIFNNRFANALSNKKKTDDLAKRGMFTQDMNTNEDDMQGNWQPNAPVKNFASALTGPEPLAEKKPKSYAERLQEIYDSNSDAQKAFQEEASNALNPADFKPSVGRRIGAALVGAAAGYGNAGRGFEMASKIADAPYENAKAQRADRLKDLGTAAGMEKDRLAQALSMAEAEQDDFYKGEGNKRANRGEVRADLNSEDQHNESLVNIEMARKRLQTAGLELKEGEDGMTRIIDLATGDVKKEFKTGVTPAEKLQAQKDLSTFTSTLEGDRQIRVNKDNVKNQIAVDDARTRNDIELQGKKDAAALDRVKAKNEATIKAAAERYKAKADADPTFKKEFDKLVLAASKAAAKTGVDVDSLLDLTGAIPKVAEDSYFDSPQEAKLKAALRAQLAGGSTGAVDMGDFEIRPKGGI